MSVSVIVCVYKEYTALNSVLHSLCKQSFKDFQVCIAQDADDQNILPTLNQFTDKLDIQLLQQDELWVEGAVAAGRRVDVKPHTGCPTVQLPVCMSNRFAVGQARRLSRHTRTSRPENTSLGAG